MDKGYEKVTVNIKDDSGKIVYSNLFDSPYHNTSAENEKLAKRYLPDPVPSKMRVIVDVYKNNVKVLTYEMVVDNLVAQKMRKTFSVDSVTTPLKPKPSDTVITPVKPPVDTVTHPIVTPIDTAKHTTFKLDSITISPKSLTIYTGGAIGKITATAVGSDTNARISLTSSNADIASILPDGTLKGLKAGSVQISAVATGYPSLTRICSVTVITEAPVLKIIDPSSDIIINQLTYTIKFNYKISSLGIDSTKDSALNLTDGPNLVSVTRSNFGVTSTKNVTLTVNRNAPGVPIITTQNPYTNNETLSWSWAAVTGAIKYQVRTSDGDFTKATGTVEQNTLTYSNVMTTDGSYSLNVRSVDALGNFSSTASQTVTLDTKIPDAVTFSGVENSFTPTLTPTWTWGPSATNPGISSYEISLDGGPHLTVSTTSFTPVAALTDNATHTLTVWQKDQVPGALGASQSFRYKTLSNVALAPSVAGPSGVKNGDITNKTNFSWIGGARGVDSYRVTVNTETYYVDQTSTTYSLPSNSPDGTYILHVQELDELGRPGADGTFNIVLDRTPPAITILTRDNFITNKNPVAISYKVDNGAPQTSNCDLGTMLATKSCSVTANDLVGNSSTSATTVYYRPDTYFMSPTGTGDGSSWESASGNLKGMIEDSTKMNKEYWLSSGLYLGDLNVKIMKNNSITIYGGFNQSSYPTNISGRGNSKFVQTVEINGRDSVTSKFWADGVDIQTSIRFYEVEAHLTRSAFNLIRELLYFESRMLHVGSSANFYGDQIVIEDNNRFIQFPVMVYGTALITHSKISNDSMQSAIFISNTGKLRIEGETVLSFGSYSVNPLIENQGDLSIDNSISIDCSLIKNKPGKRAWCKDHYLP